MASEGADELDPAGDSDADVDALVDEVRLLERMRAELETQSDNAMTVEAVTGLIEERQAELERSRRRPRA